MKILVMADVPPDPNSGAAGTEYQTSVALRRLGQDVDAVWDDGLPHRLSHGNLHYLIELPLAYKRIVVERMRNCAYDIVQVSQPHGYLAARVVSENFKDTAFIHRSHGFELRVQEDLAQWERTYRWDDNRCWTRRQASRVMAALLDRNSQQIARYADGHIVSASQCGEFLSRMGVPGEQIAVIPQGAPGPYVKTPAKAMSPKRLGRILYVGQFAFFKAPMVVAASINRLSQAHKEAEFTWVTSKDAHERVRALLNESARGRVTLLDWMPQEQLMSVYDRHGIFLFPSFFEGFGKAFIEAMARGLCVVAADNGGARDVITNFKDGLLVPTGNVNAMVDGCNYLLEHYQDAELLSREARRSAGKYTWDRVAEETVAFYRATLSAKCHATGYMNRDTRG